jgi:hypothetical protein
MCLFLIAIPCCGIPSVMLPTVSFWLIPVHVWTYVTIRGTSAMMASSILAAATGGLCSDQSGVLLGEDMVGIRDEDGRGRGSSLLHGLGHAGEHGPAEVLSAGLLGVGAADDFRACIPTSIPYLSAIWPVCGSGAYHSRWLVLRGTCPQLTPACIPIHAPALTSPAFR